MSEPTITLPISEFTRMVREIGAAVIYFTERDGDLSAFNALIEDLDPDMIDFAVHAAAYYYSDN